MLGGGIRNIASKLNNKNAFTLVEMVVVMTIIAIISLIGAPALLGAREVWILDGAAEELLSTIRDSQTRAVSITDSPKVPAGQRTKAWGILIESGNGNTGGNSDFKFLSFNTDANGGLTEQEETSEKGNFDKISSVETSIGGTSVPRLYVTYSTPFAKTSVSPSLSWAGNQPPIYEWVNLNNQIGSGEATVRLQYKNHSKTIKIRSNGDAFIE